MTKLPSAVGSIRNHEKEIIERDDENKRLDLYSDIINGRVSLDQTNVHHQVTNLGDITQNNSHQQIYHHINGSPTTSNDRVINSESTSVHDKSVTNIDTTWQPLGYQKFLYDVHIEYSPGGNLSSALSNKHCFKMKYLPYMVENDLSMLSNSTRSSSIDNDPCSTSDTINCDRGDESPLDTTHQDVNENDDFYDNNSAGSLNQSPSRMIPIDVTRETCAFLGNSEYVPNTIYKSRRVILELVSAKLSQSHGYVLQPSSSFTNLITLAEDGSPLASESVALPSNVSLPSRASYDSNSYMSASSLTLRNPVSSLNRILPSPPVTLSPTTQPSSSTPSSASSSASSSSSKKFVNYTILIKTIPGLDKYPAVIERRFSDFLTLYQGLKSNQTLAVIVDRNVSFPKKVYMGNFSLEKIAERSIEFSRLLHLCMSEFDLLWSVPFMSFLIDKELKEAHRMALFGDPDDVLALIENVYNIEQKLYIRLESSISANSSLNYSLEAHQESISALPSRSPSSPKSTAPSCDHEISARHNNGSMNEYKTQDRLEEADNDLGSTRNSSTCDSSRGSSGSAIDRSILSPINQRILVTFCMLFVTYCRTNNYQDMSRLVRKFIRLIASQEYVESLMYTRHYKSLKACLSFLMNMTQGNVIDDSIRLQLKRRLEDIDGASAELSENSSQIGSNSRRGSFSSSLRGDNEAFGSNLQSATRITKNDLTSLLRDRNFCLFQS